MARRTTQAPPQPDHLTVDEMKRGIVILQRRIAELETFDPRTAQDHDLQALQKAIESALERVFGRNTSDYDRYWTASRLDDGPISFSDLDMLEIPFAT